MTRPNKTDGLRYKRLRELGCIVCLNQFKIWTEPVMHHIRTGTGKGEKASNKETIPLCPRHHTDGGYGVAFHAGPKIFQTKYGGELELLENVNGLLRAKYGKEAA